MTNHNQKRHLSQFFTPEPVVQFMFDLAGFNPLWKVVDPACGDGAFLKEALRRGASPVKHGVFAGFHIAYTITPMVLVAQSVLAPVTHR